MQAIVQPQFLSPTQRSSFNALAHREYQNTVLEDWFPETKATSQGALARWMDSEGIRDSEQQLELEELFENHINDSLRRNGRSKTNDQRIKLPARIELALPRLAKLINRINQAPVLLEKKLQFLFAILEQHCFL